MTDFQSLNVDLEVQQQEFTIPQDHNRLVVRLSEHTWVSVSTEDEEIVGVESSTPTIGFFISPGNYLIRTDGNIDELTSKRIEPIPALLDSFEQGPPVQLSLTTDAPDQHIVDGIGEIPADGTSYCTITIQKLTYDGTPLTGDDHQDELFLRTTGGLIMDAEGNQRLRSLHLQSGQATFRLVSEPTPRFVTITVFGREPSPQKAEIQIEFV
jgi:hypothetical protein